MKETQWTMTNSKGMRAMPTMTMDNPMNVKNGTTMIQTANQDYQQIVNLALQCGASFAGIEPLALHKNRNAVACGFSSDHDAHEFCCYVRDYLWDMGFDELPITREQEFVLIWLPVGV
jgi:hypothetical protein